MNQVKVMLSGIGGYGDGYLARLLEKYDRNEIEIAGLVDPFAKSSKRISEIEARHLKLYNTLDEFYEENTCDLAVLSTPIQFHTPQILTALAHGSHVLCEKPMTGDLRDVEKLCAARDAAGKFVMIGYQWSHSPAILSMKQDVISGVYGKPVFFKTLICWPRNKAYFNRSTGWAGKKKAADGTLIYDSVANNAAAHYLHNIFFTMGKTIDSAVAPIETTAQLYRANPIENFDTALISCKFANGAKALYLASHSTDQVMNPIFEYRFEKGTILFDESEIKSDGSRHILGKLSDGSIRDYGDPFFQQMNKLDMAIENVHAQTPNIPCGIETATPQVRCIAACAEQPILDFDENRKRIGKDELLYIDGLYEALLDCYQNEHMLSFK